MSYTVNWTTKVISIPLGDLTLISGSNYSLDASDFWLEVRRLEASPADGLWAEQALDFINTQILSGITYVPIVKLINGYTWDVASTNKNVSLIGPNSNLLDAFIPGNGISVLANNSAGKQTITSGSGLDAGQDTKLTRIHSLLDLIEGTFDHAEVMRILLASAAGKLSGAEGTNVQIRDLADAKDRIDATVDENGNRTAVTLDAS